MPRQLQLRAPGHGKLPNDPNNRLKVDPLAFIGDNPFATMTEAVLFGAANTMLQIIDDTTGLDLLPAAKMLEDTFGSALSGPGMPNFLSYLDGQPATDPITGLPTPSTNPVGLFTSLLSWVTSGFGILSAGPTLLEQLISAGGGTGNSLSDFGNLFAALGMTAEQIAEDLFGVAGGNLPLLGGNLMSMLGNPNLNVLSGFDPISAGRSMLSSTLVPAGALSSATQIPAYLFGNLIQGNASSNVLPDPGFDDPAAFEGSGLWTRDGTVDHTGTAGSGSAKFVATGILGQLIGVPITVNPGDNITLGTYVKWSGITTGAGNAISLCVNAYDDGGNIVSNPTLRVAATVTAPGASSTTYTGHDVNGWVHLTGGYQVPAGTAYIRLCLEVSDIVTAGSVWFDDCLLSPQGLVDAGLLTGFENMSEGVIPGNVLQGFQGLVNMFESFAHLVDGLGSAASMSSQTGLDFSQLFAFIQDLATTADTGGSQGAINTNILGYRSNKSLSAGAHPTSEAMHTLGSFGSGGTQTTTSLAAGNAIGQTFRAAEVAQKGFFEFIASGTSLSNIFTNVYSVDPGTGAKTKLWGSNDISSQIGTALSIIKSLIPGGSQPTVNAGQNLLLEIVNAGSSALTVVTKNTGQPSHSTDFPRNIATTRVLGSTGGSSPASLTDSQVTYTSNVPYVNLGIANVPAGYVPEQVSSYIANDTWNRPGGFVTGDLVDMYVLGGAGGGQSGGYGISGEGGHSGFWTLGQYVIGADINGTGRTVLTATSLAIGVGTGGGGGVNPYTLDPGDNGTASTISGSGFTTLTGAGGGGGGRGAGSGGVGGMGSGNRTIGAYTAFGSSDVGVNQAASYPGGGGGSGYPAFGQAGAHGKIWLRTHQAGTP